MSDLIELINNLKSGKGSSFALKEAAIKQSIILSILRYLGWNVFNAQEVYPEYSTSGQGNVDYALLVGNKKVFVEAKGPQEDLNDHQEQLLKYAFSEGVPLTILTNGLIWWFYLSLREGLWHERKFFTIDIQKQQPDFIAKHFDDLLKKEKVASGEALENAERLYSEKQKQETLKNIIPVIWQKLLTEKDPRLLSVVADAVESECGMKPDPEEIKEIIHPSFTSLQQTSPPTVSRRPVASSRSTMISRKRAPSKKPQRVILFNQTIAVTSWKDVLLAVCQALSSMHTDFEQKALHFRPSDKQSFFSTNRKKPPASKPVQHTRLFVQTKLSANDIVRRSKELLEYFGHPADSLRVETEQSLP